MRSPLLTGRLRRKMLRQFASLGGGNHFLELQRDQDDGVWAMLHSGSRYLGVIVRDHYVERGRQQAGVVPKIYAKVPYLQAGTPLADEYLADLRLSLDLRASRREMMLRVLDVAATVFAAVEESEWLAARESIQDIAHNFVAEEEHFGRRVFVHRKGAIRLDRDQVGLIPGSMGTFSYVVEGRGNTFGFNSCSHGAGRAMSRAEAFHVISDNEFYDSMKGVVHRHDPRIKDEAAAAYKDVRRVMRAQRDLVRVQCELQPILSVKGQ